MEEEIGTFAGNFMLEALEQAGPFRRTISFPHRHGGFHVMPTSAGHERAQPGAYDWDGLKRGQTPFSVLQHTVAGRGRLQYERRLWRPEAGQTMLVSIPHTHRYWIEPGEEWSFFWIAITGREALRLNRAILRVAGPVFRLRTETVDALAAVCSSLRVPLSGAGQASSLAYQAIMLVYDDVMAREARNDAATGNESVDRTIAFIRANLGSALDIDTLAAVAGVSRSHFSRLFTRTKGVAPAEFVVRQRMDLAARLLANGQLSIKAVSSGCGYPDPNYFAKVFRRVYGISPTEFRSTGMYAVPGREDGQTPL
ncbi:AraC family transcriptional regulator [Methylobacterium sp. E-065]|uniref:AraC family transcriptional regulator n=1 Tax=Methylobacterium sp. E-065 TaxID=2836583 RepID=UPI0028BF101D|nr:AraC family transcriptional regulator [Methylobacterium sp. E-065]